jgi:hypothetical protein
MYDIGVAGVWRCLSCRAETDGSPRTGDPNELVTLPHTPGQREDRFCSTCGSMRTAEYAIASRGQLNRANGQGVSSSAGRIPAGVQSVMAEPVVAIHSAASRPALPNIGSFTDEELVALRTAIDAELAARRQCVVCCERPRACVFYPCKHQCTCTTCADKCRECPVCRHPIADRIVPFN